MENLVKNNEGEFFSQSRWSHCGCSHPTEKFFKQQKKEKGYKKPPFNPHNSNNNRNECNGRKPNTCFRCGSEDYFIKIFPKPDTSDNKVHWNTEKLKTCAYRLTKIDKTSENITDESESQKIYTSMARMYSNEESHRINYRDSSQLNNWILDSGDTCNMIPDISDFIPVSLLETDKYIEVAYGHFVTAK